MRGVEGEGRGREESQGGAPGQGGYLGEFCSSVTALLFDLCFGLEGKQGPDLR